MSSQLVIRSIVDVIRTSYFNGSNDEKTEMLIVLKNLVFLSEKKKNEINANMLTSLEENLLNQGYSMEEIHLNDCDMDDMDETKRGSWWKYLSDEQKILILDAEMDDYWNYAQSCQDYTDEQIINWLLN
jgi:hypothetical protein